MRKRRESSPSTQLSLPKGRPSFIDGPSRRGKGKNPSWPFAIKNDTEEKFTTSDRVEESYSIACLSLAQAKRKERPNGKKNAAPTRQNGRGGRLKRPERRKKCLLARPDQEKGAHHGHFSGERKKGDRESARL